MKLSRVHADTCLIFMVSLLAFTYGLFDRELVQFEVRFGVFVQEMLHNGPSFFPTTYHLPYPDYPSLQTFFIYLLCLPFGKLTTLCAILPSAIASSITLVLIYLSLVKHDRTWAWAAVLLTLLTYQFLDAARSLSMDPFIMLATIWAFHAADKKHWSLWLALIFGFAIRGPIGLIIPSAVVGVSLWSAQSFKQALFFGIKAFLLLGALMCVLLLAAYHAGGSAFVTDVLRMQIFGRMQNHTEKHQFFDYFSESFANYGLSFELALLTLCLFAKSLFRAKTPTLQLLRQCMFWVVIIMVGMSIPTVRKIRYIMPMVPALAILGSYCWYETQQNIKKSGVVVAINYFSLVLPVICLFLITLLKIVTEHQGLPTHAHYFSAYGVFGILSLVSLWVFCHGAKTFVLNHRVKILLIAVSSLWTMLVFIITPMQVSLNQCASFVTHLTQSLPKNTELVFFQMNPDGAAIQVLLHANAQNTPKFVQQIDWQQDKNFWFLTSEETFDQQDNTFKNRVTVIQKNKLGHRTMCVFFIK
jgi:4-amino-4-deoxy-L-arabinose transferase-like glycosyltransferase